MINSKYNVSVQTDLHHVYQTNRFNRKQSILKSATKCFREFSRNTSIHGFKYLGTGRKCTPEKLWWITVLGFCIYLCVTFTLCTLRKRNENPVFVSFRQSPMHVWDIPFPAITICPTTKIKATKYNFTHYANRCANSNLTREEMRHFMDINMFCKTGFHKHLPLPMSQHRPDVKSLNYIIEQALSLEDVLQFCAITTGTNHFHCREYFSPLFTDVGLCFSFNMLDKSELFQSKTYVHTNHANHQKTLHWTVDNNYSNTLNATFPLRITSSYDGMYFRLHIDKSLVDESCAKYKGFRVLLHHPAEHPVFPYRYVFLSTNQDYKAWIKPDIITTSSNLIGYDPIRRDCYLSNERKLKFYKVYTQHNCKLECVSNVTVRECGCVPYYIAHEASTRICGLGDLHCISRSRDQYLTLEMKIRVQMTNYDPSTVFEDLGESCDCLPSCTSIVYNTEITPDQPKSLPYNESSYTGVHITFKDSSFITVERNELFSNADFWASLGGLIGLFTGFSVVSLAEIIYFFTLKWICNARSIRRRFQ